MSASPQRPGAPADASALRPALQRPLDELVSDPRARAAFAEAGIATVGAFFATPRARLLAVKGFGARSYEKIAARLRHAAAVDLGLLPPALLGCPLATLPLAPELAAALGALGLQTAGDLLTAPRALAAKLAPDDRDALRAALDAAFAAGLAPRAASAGAPDRPSFARLCAQLLAGLEFRQQELLRRRVGIGCRAQRVRELAAHGHVSRVQMRGALAAVRRRLRQGAAALLEPLRDEALAALAGHEGALGPRGLLPGTLLHRAGHETGDPALPFRLLAFCFGGQLSVLDGRLLHAPAREVAAALRALRPLVQPARLPVAVGALASALSAGGVRIDRGVLRHLLRVRLKLTLCLDGEQGQMVAGRANPVAERALAILREQPGALSIEDLVFHYRDRHRSCHKGRLLEHLRADARLLEIGPGQWTLRERHADELEKLLPQARRLARRIEEHGTRQNARDLLDDAASERDAYLLASCLRRDPALRDLGRGDFCPRGAKLSGPMRAICRDLRRAMGELPIARFLDNQTPHRRRVVARLLRENRLFVETADNRVDLLSNYPFNEERLERLRVLVDAHLEERGGYSTIADVLARVQQSELGGGFLSEHMLGDLLRRHGPFEVLPGGFVAQLELGLAGGIQQKTREILREAGLPMTPEEILAEAPDLAEFAASLEHLLQTDPLVITDDLMHYSVA